MIDILAQLSRKFLTEINYKGAQILIKCADGVKFKLKYTSKNASFVGRKIQAQTQQGK